MRLAPALLLLCAPSAHAAIEAHFSCVPGPALAPLHLSQPRPAVAPAPELYFEAELLLEDSGAATGKVTELLATNGEGELENLLNSVWGIDPAVKLGAFTPSASSARFEYDGSDPKLHALELHLPQDFRPLRGEELAATATLEREGARSQAHVRCVVSSYATP